MEVIYPLLYILQKTGRTEDKGLCVVFSLKEILHQGERNHLSTFNEGPKSINILIYASNRISSI